MDNINLDDNFSKELMCLRLQIETLFENVGGEDCINLLNKISKLSLSEREILLKQFNNIVQKLLANTKRKKSLQDVANEKFENELYDSIEQEFNNIQVNDLSSMNAASRFKIVNGGKSRMKRKVIKFNEFYNY
ncbi:MAG: hypothetical protein SPJ04_07805 [Bdellovibrionota bacterium]|nr:hypothetical protein [Bdellovibrionota bacterium]